MIKLVFKDPNWAFPFQFHTYASDKEIRVVVGKIEGKVPYVIYFNRKNMSKAELN